MERPKPDQDLCPACHRVPRRTVLGALVGLINGTVALAIIGPTLGFIASPLRRRQKGGIWVDVLDAGALRDGETRPVDYSLEVQDGYMKTQRTYSAFLHRKGDTVTAFDPTCPHLGCHVQFKDRKRRYVCPCHGGVFDEDGNHLSGPPPRGLTRIPSKVENGRIWLYKV